MSQVRDVQVNVCAASDVERNGRSDHARSVLGSPDLLMFFLLFVVFMRVHPKELLFHLAV